jgi:hypothetical protein
VQKRIATPTITPFTYAGNSVVCPDVWVGPRGRASVRVRVRVRVRIRV